MKTDFFTAHGETFHFTVSQNSNLFDFLFFYLSFKENILRSKQIQNFVQNEYTAFASCTHPSCKIFFYEQTSTVERVLILLS